MRRQFDSRVTGFVSGSSDEFQPNLLVFDGTVDFCETAQAVDPATSARYCFERNPPSIKNNSRPASQNPR
jgi:hypothetical protein